MGHDLETHRGTVFVVGAGFSTEFGYPMARDLLPRLWDRLGGATKRSLSSVIAFHHPTWDGRASNLPEIEELLTELDTNEDLLSSLRPAGHFDLRKLRRIREDILYSIAEWFHEIHSEPGDDLLIERFSSLVRRTASAIISFNWDYELDKALFANRVTPESYGLGHGPIMSPVLLKPHGSLNWYPAKTGRHISAKRKEKLWSGGRDRDSIYCFLRWRAPRSQRRRYVPWIVPPTHLKDFGHGMLRRIWKRCVDALGVAKRIYFLGYSLPAPDWHSRYILRCGFYNQVEGVPLNGKRAKPTGKARVYVVNPSPDAFRRIEAVVGWECRWIPNRISEWLGKSGTDLFF